MHNFLSLQVRKHLDYLCSVYFSYFDRELIAFGDHVCEVTVFAIFEDEKQEVFVLCHTEQLDDERVI